MIIIHKNYVECLSLFADNVNSPFNVPVGKKKKNPQKNIYTCQNLHITVQNALVHCILLIQWLVPEGSDNACLSKES